MTKARSLDPPKLATWLLEQFSPVLKNAALAGDLMEAFKQGRSSGWYWRQVFSAIVVALLSLLRRQWGSLAYATACSGLTTAGWLFMFPHGSRSSALPSVFALFAKGFRIPWPWSLVYQTAFRTAFEAVIVGSALGAYLAFARILKAQNFLRALIVVVVVLAGGNVAATFLSVPLSGIGRIIDWMLISTPTIIALLIGLWKANPGSTPRPIAA